MRLARSYVLSYALMRLCILNRDVCSFNESYIPVFKAPITNLTSKYVACVLASLELAVL